ncbi:MAG: ABC-F family ATP-binding cassette domain-containing protein [Bacillota bacterium]
MTVLQVRNLSISFQGTPILNDVSSVLGTGTKAGLVGPNGAGKTTLLRTILGQIQPDQGSVDWIGNPRIGYVPQKWEPGAGATPLDVLGYEKAPVLGRFGISRSLWDQPCSNLSGGERTRLLLARAFSLDPEALVLDEPTNHLDIPGIEWLEKTVKEFPGSVLVVSHDRTFLDAVATEIWELRDTRLATYTGGYSAYQERLREMRANEAREYAKWQRRVRELTIEVADRRMWYAKAHDDAGKNDFYRRKAKKHARQFKAKETMLERAMAEKPDVRRPEMALKASVDHAGHRTRTILRASDLEFSYAGASVGIPSGAAAARLIDATDRPIAAGITVSLGPKDKAGLIGPNGSGKTTLIRLLLGELQPQKGVVWRNPECRVGYLSQMLDELDSELGVTDNVRRVTGLTAGEARNLLGKMGIMGDTQLQPVGTLSMGERTRVAVSCLCFGKYDALILDEPTNHLDANARDCVEQALTSFPGSLLVATHDRYFLDRVCNTIWSLENGKVRAVRGNYTAYREELARVGRSPAQGATGTRATPALMEPDLAMKELGLETEIAYLVSRITAARTPAEKEDLEQQYRTTLEDLKRLRNARAGSAQGGGRK